MEQYIECPYCAGIMEFKGDNDNYDDEDTVNLFIDEELNTEDDGNTEVETPVKILDEDDNAVRTGLILDEEYGNVRTGLISEHGIEVINLSSKDYFIKDTDCVVEMEYADVKIFRNRAKILKRGKFVPKNQRTKVLIELSDDTRNVNVRTSKGLICYSKSEVRCMKKADGLPSDEELARKQKQNNLFSRYELVKKIQKDILESDFTDKTQEECDKIKKMYDNLLDEANQLVKSINKIAHLDDEAENTDYTDKYAGKRMLLLDMIAEPGEKYFIEVGYETFGISWEPYYKIDVKSDEPYATMTMFAKINNQKSDERLDNVNITLSSGINTYEDNLLEYALGTQYIKKKQSSDDKVDLLYMSDDFDKDKQEGMTALLANNSGERRMGYGIKEDMLEMTPVNVRENNSDILHEFELPWEMTLCPKCENEVAVWQKKIEIFKNYFAIPRKGQNEYFSVDVKGLKEYNLISGWLDIYLDSDYVRRCFLNVAKAENLKIDMGRVKGVKIKSRKVADEVSNKKLQGKIRRYKYIFEVTNNLQCTIALRLYDRIPVSKVDGVEVMLNRIDDVVIDEATGKCTWGIKVNPLSVKEIAFEYAITYPAKEKFVIE